MNADPLHFFTRALATRLPGTWTASVRDNSTPDRRTILMDRLWDLGTVHGALFDVVNDHVGQVSHPAGLDLVVVRRPRHRDQYLVAALVPEGYGPALLTTELAVPFGIAVADAPARAAAAVTRRLLPSYQAALRTVDHPAGWSNLTNAPVGRAEAATGRNHHATTATAPPPTAAPEPLHTGARHARH